MLIPWASQQRGGSPAPLIPIAVADFKNGVYSIDGAAKTYADLWANGAAHLVAGAGFEISGDWPGGSGSASGSATAAADLLAVANPQIGFSAVIDVSPTTTGDGGEYFYHLGLGNLVDVQLYYYADDAQLKSAITQTFAGLSLGSPHKIALTYSPSEIAFSVDGLPTLVGGVPGNYATLTTLLMYLSVQNFSGLAGGATMCCPKIVFYPQLTDAQLQALST